MLRKFSVERLGVVFSLHLQLKMRFLLLGYGRIFAKEIIHIVNYQNFLCQSGTNRDNGVVFLRRFVL